MAFLSNTFSYEISVLIEVAFPVTEKQSEKNSLKETIVSHSIALLKKTFIHVSGSLHARRMVFFVEERWICHSP